MPITLQKTLIWTISLSYNVIFLSFRTNAAYNIKHNNLISIPYIQREIVHLGTNAENVHFLGKSFGPGEEEKFQR